MDIIAIISNGKIRKKWCKKSRFKNIAISSGIEQLKLRESGVSNWDS